MVYLHFPGDIIFKMNILGTFMIVNVVNLNLKKKNLAYQIVQEGH